VAEFPHQEPELGRVISLAAIVATRRADVRDEAQSAAFLQPYLAGTLPFGELAAVFPAAPEYVAGEKL